LYNSAAATADRGASGPRGGPWPRLRGAPTAIDDEGEVMHTSTSARTVAMVLIAVLCGTVLALPDRGPAAAAAARHCTGIESDSSVTAEKVIEVKQRSTITADIYLCSKSDGRYVR